MRVIEIWCIGAAASSPFYQSSRLTYYVKSDMFNGVFMRCAQ